MLEFGQSETFILHTKETFLQEGKAKISHS